MVSDKFHLLRLRVDSTPYQDDPPNAGEFYKALGLFIVAWGRFEGHFVADLLTISALTWDSNPVHQIPMAWEKRGDIWNKAFRTLQQLAPYKDAALGLTPDIKAAAKSRNILVHSMWAAFVSANPLALESINLKSVGDELEAGNIPISLPSLKHMILAANTLNSRLAPISIFLCSLRPTPENVETILRPTESLLTHLDRPKRG